MTKLRAPISVEQALARIQNQLPGGIEQMASVTGRSDSLVRAWSDPDRRERIPLDDAIELDLAFQAAGGIGAPLYETYATQLDIAAAMQFADQHELLSRTERLIREGGEAHAALVRACQPGASDQDRANALRELSEAFEEFSPVLALLGADRSRAPP